MKQEVLDNFVSYLEKQNIQFRSGKYFKDSVEIKYIDNYLSKIFKNYSRHVLKASDIEEFKSQLVLMSEEDHWYDLPLVTKAKELGSISNNEGEPFPLDDKQYTIINRMLYHPLDEVMFITTGVGGSGKSTFLNIIKQLFNNDVASVPLSELQGFMIAKATQHRLVASDEIGSKELNNDILKTLISKQEIDVNPKYGKPYHTLCQSSFFYSCNKAPKLDVTDTGILRRIVFYSRNTKIENPDPKLNRRVYTEEELLWIARRALAFENDNWFDIFKKETRHYLKEQNSVWICRRSPSYSDYRQECSNKGLKAYSEPNWRSIKDLFNSWTEEEKSSTDSPKESTYIVNLRKRLDLN